MFLGASLVLLALVPLVAQTSAPPATGSMSGAITDPAGGVLPGVTVTVTSGATRRTEVTNSDGRFAFAGLPVGWYRLEGELAGFRPVVQDPVAVRTGAIRHIVLEMRVGPLMIADYIAFSPKEAARHAMVIARVKLLSPIRTSRDFGPSTEWLAEVIDVAKDPAGVTASRQIRFWQPHTGFRRESDGQEMIAFLSRHTDGALHAFPHNMIDVQSGIVSWREDPRDDTPLDKPVATVMDALRRLSDQATAGPGKEKELTLKQGLSLPWPGTRLGHSRDFDNDIYGLKCSPVVTVGGHVLQWIHRLHVTSGRAFVEPCEELELNQPDSKWPRPAGFADWIFEATMAGDDVYPQMQLKRLALPGWGYQANGAFCGRYAAYWSLERDSDTQVVVLHARIADLFTQAVVVRERLGPISLETDNPGAFETPVWDAQCRVVTMSGERYGLKIATLTVAR